MLDREGNVNVRDLAAHFQVSRETIRRYLEELEHARKLKKVYGGAIKWQSDNLELPQTQREIAKW